jgi:tetratricopeptide (TPR) repeat protein
MHRWLSAVLSLVLVLLVAASVSAQPPAGAAAERQVAFDLYDQHRLAEALPLLEKLAARHPDDIVVQERLGVCLAGVASGLKDPDERKKMVLRARAVLLHAKELGDNSNLLQTILGSIPEDGVLPAFSSKAEVDELMKAAEADFSRGAFDQALVKYVKALDLDPTLYHAALYAGDTCFNQKKYDAAGEWFA